MTRRLFCLNSSNGDSTVKVSFMELYNEELTDLLSSDNEQRLRLLEDRSGINVQGLEEYMVKSTSEIYQVRFGITRSENAMNYTKSARPYVQWQCSRRFSAIPAAFSFQRLPLCACTLCLYLESQSSVAFGLGYARGFRKFKVMPLSYYCPSLLLLLPWLRCLLDMGCAHVPCVVFAGWLSRHPDA